MMMAKRRVTVELEEDDYALLERLRGEACAREKRPITLAAVFRDALRALEARQ
jgi:hypothetical protein